MGSKRLLILSSLGTALSALVLGIGLNTHAQALSGVSIILFVLFFSIGLAPIPWVVLSEVVPLEARTAVGAVAVSVNWLTNFVAVCSREMTQNEMILGLIYRERRFCLCKRR